MEKKASFLINILIILLIMALITVMLKYYLSSSPLSVTSSHLGADEISSDVTPVTIKDPILNTSGDNIKVSGDDIIIVSGENNDNTQIIESGDKTDNNIFEKPPVVIISSENDISSKEKGEILSEIDKTLMELLEVVDKVKTVDETKLIIDDSEVQQWKK